MHPFRSHRPPLIRCTTASITSTTLLLLLSLSNPALAANPPITTTNTSTTSRVTSTTCLSACDLALSPVTFTFPPSNATTCLPPTHLTSLAICILTYCPPTTHLPAWSLLAQQCSTPSSPPNTPSPLPPFANITAIPASTISRWPHLNLTTYWAGLTPSPATPVFVDSELWESAAHTRFTWEEAVRVREACVRATVWFWVGVVVFFGVMGRWWSWWWESDAVVGAVGKEKEAEEGERREWLWLSGGGGDGGGDGGGSSPLLSREQSDLDSYPPSKSNSPSRTMTPTRRWRTKGKRLYQRYLSIPTFSFPGLRPGYQYQSGSQSESQHRSTASGPAVATTPASTAGAGAAVATFPSSPALSSASASASASPSPSPSPSPPSSWYSWSLSTILPTPSPSPPPRLTTFLLILYFLLNLILPFLLTFPISIPISLPFTSHRTPITTNPSSPAVSPPPQNLYYPLSPLPLPTRHLASLTGVLSLAHFPPLLLTGTRNTPLSLSIPFLSLTDWSFETNILLHRWLARTATLLAAVHSVAYCAYAIQTSGWGVEGLIGQFAWSYWNWGCVGTLAMVIVCVLAGAAWRGRWGYETFLTGHVLGAVIVGWGTWVHLGIFQGVTGEAYKLWLWVAGGLWVVERGARGVRLVWCNWSGFGVGNGNGCGLGLGLGGRATVRWDEGAELLTLSVPVKAGWSGKRLRPRAGEYYFVYLLHGWGWWESHPFTAASWSVGPGGDERVLKFLIRPYDGATRRLRDLATRRRGAEAERGRVRVLIEGPYGPAKNLRRFDELVFVVGGTGVAVALAYLTDVCERMGREEVKGYRVRKMRVIWAVRTVEMFEGVWQQHIVPMMQAVSQEKGFELELDVYITRSIMSSDPIGVDSSPCGDPTAQASPAYAYESRAEDQEQSEHSPLLSPSSSPKPEQSSPSFTQAQLLQQDWAGGANTTLTTHHGRRPSISSLIEAACCNRGPAEREYSGTPATNHSVAIVSCGPVGLTSETRKAVVRQLERSDLDLNVDIEFYNESYSW